MFGIGKRESTQYLCLVGTSEWVGRRVWSQGQQLLADPCKRRSSPTRGVRGVASRVPHHEAVIGAGKHGWVAMQGLHQIDRIGPSIPHTKQR